MRLSLTNICFFLFLSCTSLRNDQSKIKEVDFNLEIKQLVYGSYTQNTFIVDGNRFYIFEYSTSKEGQLERNETFSMGIKDSALKKIIQYSNPLFALKSEYINAELGGLSWEISLTNKDTTKFIKVENYSLSEIDSLFNSINQIIPSKKPTLYKY